MSTRADLQFMRRRARPGPAADKSNASAGPQRAPTGEQTRDGTSSAGGGSTAVADFLRGRSSRPGRAPAEAPKVTRDQGSRSTGSSVAGTRPAAGTGNPLDLDGSAATGEQQAAGQPPAAAASAVGDFLKGRSTRPGREPVAAAEPTAAPPPASSGSSLDLGTSQPEQAAPAAAAANPLDLGSSGEPELPGSRHHPQAGGAPTGSSVAGTRPGVGTGSSLDLDEPSGATETAGRTSPSGRHRRLIRHDLSLRGITAGERRRIDAGDPLVHLTRAQSAFGSLDVQPAIPEGAHLTLGAAYEVGGREGVVLPGLRNMGPDQRSPIFRVSTGGLVVNLRQITAVDRFLIYAVLSQGDKRMPGGTVVVTTYGGARLELPLTTKPTYGAQALLTAYVVEGRIVLRAEHDPFSGTLHQVCDAYGFSELTWRDPFTPLV